MPLASTLAERLNILEKNMVASDEKPFDEELFNMMKVCVKKDVKQCILKRQISSSRTLFNNS